MNRLAESSSPYLLLHKDNPVDWYPWGPEALETAKREDKPIFLSVGYSTCYWCHVMERESFTDEETAKLMNRSFVNIKLDREERPELDEIYMSATQILTQHGGWPNSLFLTPALEPFFAGTYFPPVDRPGMPGFRSVLASMAEAWRTRRTEVEEQAKSVARAIRHSLEERPEPATELPDGSAAGRSLAGLERSFDPQWGGFGSAPKFPSPSNLFLLLELASSGERAAEMLTTTLDRMARGGLYDQLGGGFHRYATDREWNVPHFEKMLYDNGWLLEVYGREHRRTGSEQARRTVIGTAGFLERELTAPEGAFWSALDAETDGHEGAYYIWTRDELLDVLGEEDFGFLAPIYGFDRAPFFEGHHYVLHLPETLEAQAARRKLPLEELEAQLAPLRAELFEARSRRKRLLRDDKILADWNGTAISGLATAGRLIGSSKLVDQAAAGASFVIERMRGSGGVLLHSWRQGEGAIEAFLADYTYLVRGLLALERAALEHPQGGGASPWLDAAVRLTEEQIARLGDPNGGFFAAAESADVLFRSKDLFDGALPSANAIAILNLLDLAELTEEHRWREEADRALRGFAPLLERLAEPARMMTIAARRAAATGAASDTSGDTGGVSLDLRVEAPGSGGETDFHLTVSLEPGWHIHAPYPEGDAPEWVRPLEIKVEGAAELLELELPQATELPALPGRDRVRIYEGRIQASGRLRLEPDPAAPPALVVSLQACDETRCLAPVERRLAVEPRVS